ncbi:hypothetical protein [Nonomuraea sp. NPDC005692]|uniref:hypothetical protein n=1 Tax=Nonomuraea sp. NPDC005692 TaxID=3157168 RepID=UPI0033DD881A
MSHSQPPAAEGPTTETGTRASTTASAPTSTPTNAETGVEPHALVLPALRRDRRWITASHQYNIVVHARTLPALQASAQQALTLLLGAPPTAPVRVSPRSDDLDVLARARVAYDAALRQAVMNLRDQGASWADDALACQVRVADAKAAAKEPAPDVI